MEAIAIAKHIRQSPKKVRFVLDAVRGKKVNEALNTLEFMNKKAAGHILKTLKSVLIAPCQFLNHYYLTALLVFIVETVNWDFSHALYFWILVLLIPSIKKPLKQANYFKE